MEELMLSILVPTYHQEQYIGQAIDSIMMQETQYRCEVLIGDDCSPDGTQQVLRAYEQKYPGRLTVLYRAANLGAIGAKYENHIDLLRRAKGKYTMFLEGDDYWLDAHKVEEQITFLETHPDYVAVAHNCLVVDEHSRPKDEQYPECKDEEYTFAHYQRNILPGQLATLMFRNIYTHPYFDTSILEKKLVPGDRIYDFALLTAGRIHCIQKPMTAYRHVTAGGTSYSANVRYDFTYDEYWHRELCGFAYDTENEEAIACAEVLYFTCLMHGIRWKRLQPRELLRYAKNLHHPCRAAMTFAQVYLPILSKRICLHLLGRKRKTI